MDDPRTIRFDSIRREGFGTSSPENFGTRRGDGRTGARRGLSSRTSGATAGWTRSKDGWPRDASEAASGAAGAGAGMVSAGGIGDGGATVETSGGDVSRGGAGGAGAGGAGAGGAGAGGAGAGAGAGGGAGVPPGGFFFLLLGEKRPIAHAAGDD
jgi:hypothetical protein